MTQWLARAAAVLRASNAHDGAPVLDARDPRMIFASEHEWRRAMCNRDVADPREDSVNSRQRDLQGRFSG